MEILSLLRLNGKRVVALSTMGMITGGLAAGAVSKQPAMYEANVTVFVSQALPTGASAFDIGPLVSDFTEALRLPEVRRSVADTLARPEKDLVVTATRNGTDGGSVRVVGDAASASDAEAMVVALSQGAMKALGQQQVDRAAGLEDQRASEAETARGTRDKLLADSGYADPEEVYTDVLNEANRLSLASSDPTTQLAAEARTAAAAEATRLRSQLPALRAKAEEYRVAQKKLELAEDNLNAAAKERVAAEATLSSATDSNALSLGETLEISPMSAMVQAFAAAFIATFGAGIAFFFGVDSVRKRRALRRAAVPADTPAPMAAAEEWALDVLGESPPTVQPGEDDGPSTAEAHGYEQRADASFAAELIEVGISGSPQVSEFDSWGNPRSMFTKPLRANGSVPGHAELEGSSVATVDHEHEHDLDDDLDADDLTELDDADDLDDASVDTVDADDDRNLARRTRRRARRRH